MKNGLIAIFVSLVGFTFAQEMDKLSKKELKLLLLQEQKKNDSLQKIIINVRSENTKKDSLISDLNDLILKIEKKLEKLEFETSSCAISRDSLKNNLLLKEKEVVDLNDSLKKTIQTKTANLPPIECTFKEEKLPDCSFPVTIKSCIFGNYKNIKTGTPDFDGNYSYTIDLLKKVNGKYVLIKNAELFNALKMDLLEKINKEIKQNFEQFLIETDGSECFENAKAPNISFDDLSIDFGVDKIDFVIKYSTSFLCFSEKSAIVTYSLPEIVSYLNK